MHGLSGIELGPVSLTVADLERSRRFYEDVVGLVPGDAEADGSATMTDGAGRTLVQLEGGATGPLDPTRTGLFHLAVLVPTRRHLAQALMRLAARRWPLDGASDHLVSEALYLSDPDGNGIEIYRDRPRSEWPRDAGGELRMATLPLDLQDVAGELHEDPGEAAHVAPGTHIGHVHLQVSDLQAAERFYSALLGLEVTVRGYPGALFVAADGYHHHLGLNTWNSRGGAAPHPGSVGLRSYEIRLPADQLTAVEGRLESAGFEFEQGAEGVLVRDSDGIATLLRPV